MAGKWNPASAWLRRVGSPVGRQSQIGPLTCVQFPALAGSPRFRSSLPSRTLLDTRRRRNGPRSLTYWPTLGTRYGGAPSIELSGLSWLAPGSDVRHLDFRCPKRTPQRSGRLATRAVVARLRIFISPGQGPEKKTKKVWGLLILHPGKPAQKRTH